MDNDGKIHISEKGGHNFLLKCRWKEHIAISSQGLVPLIQEVISEDLLQKVWMSIKGSCLLEIVLEMSKNDQL